MSFTPMLPVSGYSGWRFLQRTIDTQKQAFSAAPMLSRDVEHFREKIGTVSQAEDLVKDRALLRVALGAFGLDGDIDNKFFVQKVLSDGTRSDEALANRLSDPRYAAFSKAFGLSDDALPETWRDGFADRIISRYKDRQFEIAVGDVDGDMRLALNLKAGLGDIISEGGSDTSQWFRTMGTPPIRKVFETAMGFPSSFGTLDIDKQREQFQERARSLFGTDNLSKIASPENQEKLIRHFLTRASVASFNAATTSAQTALTLMSSMPRIQYAS